MKGVEKKSNEEEEVGGERNEGLLLYFPLVKVKACKMATSHWLMEMTHKGRWPHTLAATWLVIVGPTQADSLWRP